MRSPVPEEAASDGEHSHSIELNLRDLNQLFNSLDPSPFIERDLNDDAEEFIVSWAQEFPPTELVRLRIHLDQWPAEDPQELIRQAVHSYFAHRAKLTAMEFRRLIRLGRTSLIIGLVFLVACLLVIRTLPTGQAGPWAGVLRESLTIAGWVAMWRPMQIYLYDWWPLLRRRKLYVKLSHMPVDVIRHEKS